MRMTIPALLAVLTLSVTMACGSSSDIKTPANQSYRFEGLTTVVTWEASREATHYIVYYDDFFGDNCRVDSRGGSQFLRAVGRERRGNQLHPPQPRQRELLLGGGLQQFRMLRNRRFKSRATERPSHA